MMLMKKLSFDKSLLFSLMAAILILQWSATHIHLAGEHEHGSGQHQHEVVSHQHHLASHHADVIDIADVTLLHADSYKIVEIEHVCTQSHSKSGQLIAVITSDCWNALERNESSKGVVASYQRNIYKAYHQYTSIQLRAPPLVS